MRLGKIMGTGLLLGGFILVSQWWLKAPDEPLAPRSLPQSTTVQSAEVKSFRAVMVRQHEDSRQVLTCEAKGCTSLAIPDSSEVQAVTDGVSWYRYHEVAVGATDTTKRILERVWIAGGRQQALTEQTPLVRPRDLLMSPDGTKVAYWLDNIDAPEKRLTELWLYDSIAGSNRLLLEKVSQNAVASRVRWNRASSHLFFISSAAEIPSTLTVVASQAGGVNTAFSSQDASDMRQPIQAGTSDIDASGKAIAYAVPSSTNAAEHYLDIVSDTGKHERTEADGRIVYIQWMRDGGLLYLVQSGEEASFWMLKGSITRLVATATGVVLSAASTSDGTTLLVALARGGATELTAFDNATAAMTPLTKFASNSGTLFLVQVNETAPQSTAAVAGTRSVADDQLIAFIDKKLAEIVGEEEARAVRILITKDANTVFIDYETLTKDTKRILVTVSDTTQGEWSIKRRYRIQNGEWLRTEGPALAEPPVARWYEWENALQQWILK